MLDRRGVLPDGLFQRGRKKEGGKQLLANHDGCLQQLADPRRMGADDCYYLQGLKAIERELNLRSCHGKCQQA